jgi:hypothetical protein
MPKVVEDHSISSIFSNSYMYVNEHVGYLNNSKFFAGVVMILLNIGSKFISVQFSRSAEEYLKYSITKQVLIFAMAWMGTRDIYTALVLTAVFVVLSEYMFNEDSDYCIVPHKYRVLRELIDENNDGEISQEEMNNAVEILKKAKKQKELKVQKQAFNKFKSADTSLNNDDTLLLSTH